MSIFCSVLLALIFTVILCRWQIARKKRISVGVLLTGIICAAILTTVATPVLVAGAGGFTHEYWAKIHTGYGRPISTIWFGWFFASSFICILPAFVVVLYFQDAAQQSKKAVIVASGLAAVICFFGISSCLGARSSAPTNACINNMRIIDAAKNQWALENNENTNDIPTWNDLRPYIGRTPEIGKTNSLPRCPLGGTYTIGQMSELPKCSLGGYHVLE